MPDFSKLIPLALIFILFRLYIYFNFYHPQGRVLRFRRNVLNDFSGYTVDYSPKFCTIEGVIAGNNNQYNRITLVLHVSYSRFGKDTIDQAISWEGPVSLAILFAPGHTTTSNEVQCIYQKLRQYRNLLKQVQEYLTVNFVFFGGFTCNDKYNRSHNTGIFHNCTVQEIEYEYPINRIRNAARKTVTTKYMVMADSDHYFSKGFETKMLHLANKTLNYNSKIVLVYRIFEVDRVVKKPDTKTELQTLYKNGSAREFHKNLFNHHKIPLQASWFLHPEHKETTSIQMYRQYLDSRWEPQFVSTKAVPFHDERFVYPIKDNTELRWEMCRAGYVFAIVHDVFMFHWGYKSVQSERKTVALRGKMATRAKEALAAFNKRIDRLFPKTKYTCPSFNIPLKTVL